MDQSELLRHCTKVLEQLGLRYFVTGSVATIFYGEPRFTNDIDIVVDLPTSRISDFCRAFPSEDFYISEESARRAVSRKGQFNVIHPASGLKVDVMIPSEECPRLSLGQRGQILQTQFSVPRLDHLESKTE